MATIIHIPDDDANDLRLNELLDEAMNDTSAPPTGSPSGDGGRDNPLLDDAFADVFSEAADRLAAASDALEQAAEDLADGAQGWETDGPTPDHEPGDWFEPPPASTPVSAPASRPPTVARPPAPPVAGQPPAPPAPGTPPGGPPRPLIAPPVPVGNPVPTAYPVAYPLANPVAQNGPGTAQMIAGGRQLATAKTAGGLMSGMQAMGAGLGPVGMAVAGAVDAGVGIIKSAFERMRAMVDDAGRMVKQIASNDGLGLIQSAGEAAAKGLEGIPVVGGMVASAFRAVVAPVGLFKTAMEAFTGRAKELSRYSGEIALGQAIAEMNQTFADMREASLNGAKYGELLVREQQLNQKFQEALQPLKEKLLEILPVLAQMATQVVTNVVQAVELLQFLPDAMSEGVAKAVLNQQERAAKRQQAAGANAPVDALGDIRRMMDRLQIPGAPVAARADALAPFQANNQIPVLLKKQP